jgi:hypothetical protein
LPRYLLFLLFLATALGAIGCGTERFAPVFSRSLKETNMESCNGV